MSKINSLKKGDMVSAKKFSGEEFLGLYEHGYDCGDHCIFDGVKKYCVKHNTVKKATPEQEEIIKETIIKPLREEKKRKAAEARRNERERLRLEELIEALETEIADLETEMCKPEYVSDIKALNRMDTRLRAAKAELDDAYDAWAELG